ncbi:MAG: CinA family protein [Rhodospirillales bacterium]|nr:CinA family protein [Rhodospirillales bacterium]
MAVTFPAEIVERAGRLLVLCREEGVRVATAESCTGGLIAACLTEIAGSSDVVDRGFVTYANEAKRDLLGVPDELLMRVGAVSEEVARAMAEGALARSDADLAVAVTGIAGPGGGTVTKPVGLVHHACAGPGDAISQRRIVYPGERGTVRLATVATALDMLIDGVQRRS